MAPDDTTLVFDCIAPLARSVRSGSTNADDLVQAVDISSTPWRPQPAVTYPVWAGLLTFSPNGRLLAAGQGNGAGAGAELFDVNGPHLHPRVTLPGYGDDVAFTPDSRRLLWSHDGRIDLVSVARGVHVRPFAAPNGGPSSTISLSPDGSLVAASDGTDIRLLDTSTGQVVVDLPGSTDPPCCTVLAAADQSITAMGGTPDDFDPTTSLTLIRFDLAPGDLIERAWQALESQPHPRRMDAVRRHRAVSPAVPDHSVT